MAAPFSIVTKTGDKGTTGLFGGERLPKDHPRIHAYGTVDELNACIGLVLAENGLPDAVRSQLMQLQNLLFRVGGDLATPMGKKVKEDRISENHVAEIERWIADLESTLPEQTRFILPGGSKESAQLHLGRTVCRRAERWVVTLSRSEQINDQVRIFLNRLSDYLFLAARKANIESGIQEAEVQY